MFGVDCLVLFCHIVPCVLSSFVSISLRERDLVVLLSVLSCFHVYTCVLMHMYVSYKISWFIWFDSMSLG